jgi:hypothetical protein
MYGSYEISVGGEAALDARKPLLRLAILRRNFTASRTPTAGVLRRYGYQQPATPRQFVLQLTAQFEWARVEHGTIQACLPLDVLAVLFLAAPR